MEMGTSIFIEIPNVTVEEVAFRNKLGNGFPWCLWESFFPRNPPPPPPICPLSQPFQAIGFLPSPGFSPSSLKDKIHLHRHKIVELVKNILKFLYQVGKKNI